ncbi:MAG: AMP-binding protein, partial [Stellaceae bacterium]
MTADYIDFHAAERPDAVAIINNGRSITYPQVARDIRKFTHALRALGLPPGSKAVIDCEDAYHNWLLRLAFEPLRVITATVKLPDRPDGLSLVSDSDIALSSKNFTAGTRPRHLRTTPEWLRATLASGDEDREPTPEKLPHDPIRIVLTSGTTGRSKTLLYTRRVHETSIARTLWRAGFTRRSRYLLALPNTVAGPTACLRAGGTVVIEERMPVGAAISTHAITHTTLPPFMLKHVLDELPAGHARSTELMVLSFGAAL